VGDRLILLGRVAGVFGVQGWVKLESFTAPRENILRYRPWRVRRGGNETVVAKPQGRVQGRGVVALLPGTVDRDAAAALVGAEIWIERDRLPKARMGEWYWADLEGLDVVTVDGVRLGTVSHVVATGANDVLVVSGERERLIPFLPGSTVTEVDLAARTIRVDWDPDF
jgi:16S rRNA processing protein RimM